MNTYYIAGIPVSDELYHHGILGQKWGVRRYQNPDGSLTAEGKQRYYASLYRGTKLLDKNKDRGSGYKKAAIKTAARSAALAGIIGTGKEIVLGSILGADLMVVPLSVAMPAAVPAVIAAGAALTMRDVYKAIRQDKDITNAYKAGVTQKEYREVQEKYGN